MKTVSRALPLAGIRKIAILRANALGDFIFALPALQALRTTYPQAEIVYLGKTWHQEFVPGHVPAIDRVVIVPPYPGVGKAEDIVTSRAELDAFFDEMQHEQFDLALQLHGGGRFSNPFLLRLGARHTIGLRTPDAAELEVSIPYVFYQNEVLRLLEVVSYVGARTDDIVPRLPATRADIAQARKIVEQYGKQKTGKFVVLHPGASDSRRHWPAENFAAVAHDLYGRGFDVFVTGTPEEHKLVQAVITEAHGKAADLCGQLSLGALTGLLARADLVVSNDTGPLHLAGALGAKSVGIYWIGNLITAGHMTRSGHRPQVSWTTRCPVCDTSCVASGYPFDASACKHAISFVSDVTIERVLGDCYELLGC